MVEVSVIVLVPASAKSAVKREKSIVVLDSDIVGGCRSSKLVREQCCSFRYIRKQESRSSSLA